MTVIVALANTKVAPCLTPEEKAVLQRWSSSILFYNIQLFRQKILAGPKNDRNCATLCLFKHRETCLLDHLAQGSYSYLQGDQMSFGGKSPKK
jgi:hypothetical protein